ncbi:MAG: HepT-like ribonuclease domain-containing protein [Candidatus Sumerlaeaceae bacterium]
MDRLEHILEAIDRIEEVAAAKGEEAFLTDRMVQVWMVYHIQIIGEAVRSIREELQRLRPNIPWAQIAAMRSILVHNYFGVDLHEVWAAVEKDIPQLKPAIQELLHEARTKRD